MANRNARVIIPLALGIWLASIGIITLAPDGLEGPLFGLLVVSMAIAIPLVVLYLLSAGGWRALARSYRLGSPYQGDWQTCAAGAMAPVSVDDPRYARERAYFIGVLRVATDEGGLYLSTPVSRLPIFSAFFPPLLIPWREVVSARPYQARGWISGGGGDGIRARYDPNYTGTFIELRAGEALAFIQLPESVLAEHLPQLPG
jgi:hypothetical protein